MNTWFKTIIYIIIIILLISVFSASYTSHNLENLAYVVALGIDKANNNKNKLMVTFQFIKIESQSSNSSSGESDIVIEQVYANSIDQAINLMNSYIGKEVNLSHCSVIIFSTELAKEGISGEIYSLINNEEIRPNTSLVISKCEANSYITNAKPNIEKIITKYYDTFSLTSSYTGYSQNIGLGRFFTTLKSNTQEATTILGNLNQNESEDESKSGEKEKNNETYTKFGSSEENTTSELGIIGGRNTENAGIAIFKDDKFIGELTPEETICHLLIVNDIKECVFSFPYEKNNNKIIDLKLNPSKKAKIKVDTSTNDPKITIYISLNGTILSITDESDYETSDELELISFYAEKCLKDSINKYLDKISKEYNADIAGFGKTAVSHFLTNSKWNNYDWKNKFKNSCFTINLNVNVSSSLMLSK